MCSCPALSRGHFPSIPPQPLAFTVFLPPLLQQSLRFGRKACDIDILSKLIVPQPYSLCISTDCGSPFNRHLLQVEVSWWGLRDALIYGNIIMALGLSSILCHIPTELSAVAQGVSSSPTQGSYNLTFSCIPPGLSQCSHLTNSVIALDAFRNLHDTLCVEKGTVVSVVLQPDVDGMYLCF